MGMTRTRCNRSIFSLGYLSVGRFHCIFREGVSPFGILYSNILASFVIFFKILVSACFTIPVPAIFCACFTIPIVLMLVIVSQY